MLSAKISRMINLNSCLTRSLSRALIFSVVQPYLGSLLWIPLIPEVAAYDFFDRSDDYRLARHGYRILSHTVSRLSHG